MNLPKDISMPFFSYGIFKPGQIAYPRIKDCVENKRKTSVNGILKEKDGIPLLFKSDYSNVYGYLISFYSDIQKDAYIKINEIEPSEVYKWETIQTDDGQKANVLLGRSENKGASDIEHCNCWNGLNDPFFVYGIKEVYSILEEGKNHGILEEDNNSQDRNSKNYKRLFRLQMAYTLLWSIIERYTALKYGLKENPTSRVKKIACEDIFVESLRINAKRREYVYRTDRNNEGYELDPLDPHKSINYYYQLRSNIVHRGKSVNSDIERLESSLEELIKIFKDVLRTAFYDDCNASVK
jgi:hypothetical protein